MTTITTIRHEICQKFYTAKFSGQNFYTLNFTKFQQFWCYKQQKMSENGDIYAAGKKFYTAAGSDGSEKSHL